MHRGRSPQRRPPGRPPPPATPTCCRPIPPPPPRPRRLTPRLKRRPPATDGAPAAETEGGQGRQARALDRGALGRLVDVGDPGHRRLLGAGLPDRTRRLSRYRLPRLDHSSAASRQAEASGLPVRPPSTLPIRPARLSRCAEAISSSTAQNSGSSASEVAWPARLIERFLSIGAPPRPVCRRTDVVRRVVHIVGQKQARA